MFAKKNSTPSSHLKVCVASILNDPSGKPARGDLAWSWVSEQLVENEGLV